MPENQLTTQKSGLHIPENVRLYMDQMFQTHVAIMLRRTGYDIIRASEVGQSRADDRQILKKAINDNRILVTLDEHFGDWVVLPLHRHPGVILLWKNEGRFPSMNIPFEIKSIDWESRGAERKGKAATVGIDEIKAKIRSLLSLGE